MPLRSVDSKASLWSDADLLAAYVDRGITDIVSVPCSITDTWHSLAADAHARGEANLIMTSHEGNLAGIAAGIHFGTGRVALVHMQNSGLPNAGDGFISLASREVFGIPMAAMITYRGATTSDDSEPHQAIGRRTDVMCEAVFGDSAMIRGHRSGRGLREDVLASIDGALSGSIGVVKVAGSGFVKTVKPVSHPRDLVSSGSAPRGPESKGASSLDASLRGQGTLSRDEAIRRIAALHQGAAVVYCNGYTARAARAIVDRPGNFYNIGYMGGTLAIGWALARCRPDLEVVVVDGDQNALMSCMKDHLWSDYPRNLHWYVLDNAIGASVGTSTSLPLGPMYDQLTRVVRTQPDEPGTFRHPRVGAAGAEFPTPVPAAMIGSVASLAHRFRSWLAS